MGTAKDDNHFVLRSGALFAALVLASQAVDGRLGRFGSVGRTLTDVDIAQITRLASTLGKPPRLVFGAPSMIAGLTTVSVFLEPDATDREVPRGRMLRLDASQQSRGAARSDWHVKSTYSYASIPVPGKRHFEISGDQDIGWPFVVDGELDDSTLLSIVAFIRSRPPIPDSPAGTSPREVGSAPISVIARRDTGIVVALRTSEATGFRVTLVRGGQQWMIVNYEMWIV